LTVADRREVWNNKIEIKQNRNILQQGSVAETNRIPVSPNNEELPALAERR